MPEGRKRRPHGALNCFSRAVTWGEVDAVRQCRRNSACAHSVDPGAEPGVVHAAPACEPAKLATKYPKLAGKTINIGQDGESPPFSSRDPKDFDHLIGLDADLARAVFACVGVPIEFRTGAWSGLIPALWPARSMSCGTPCFTRPSAPSASISSATWPPRPACMVPKGNPKKIKALDDLCGLSGTASLGTTQEAQLREASVTCVTDGKRRSRSSPSTDIPAACAWCKTAAPTLMSTNKFLVGTVAENPDARVPSMSSPTRASPSAWPRATTIW